MKKNLQYIFALIIIIPFFILVLFSKPVFGQSESPTPEETLIEVQIPTTLPDSVPCKIPTTEDIEILKIRIDGLEQSIQTQTDAYNATISRWESNLNLILVIIAVVGVLIAILSIGVIKEGVNRIVEHQLKQLTKEQIDRITETELKEIRSNYEPKFTALYEEYRKTLGKK